MQATVSESPDGRVAELAWVIGTSDQGKGLAKSAAALVADWLTEQGITRLGAHIHPQHHASQAVAASLGLHRTDHLVDGEEQWLKAG
jgi:RimJ/RimL family protein N-acetyltransferase